MKSRVKFNVIVPTRERADTLVHCLRSILAQDYERLNVIVSDNASADHTRDVVASISDPRLTYVNTGRRLSMSDNWEFALGHAVDGWAMFLGDDDGLCAGALRRLDALIREHDVEAVVGRACFFLWPDNFEGMADGKLRIPLLQGAEVLSSRDMVAKVFRGAESHARLPWLYQGGLASVDLINRARGADGRFFQSQIPDLYSAVALSFATERYLSVEEPVAINGLSRHSTGGGPQIQKFKTEDNIPFDASLVSGESSEVVRSVPLILYDCYLKSRHLHDGKPGFTLDDPLRLAVEVAPDHLRERIAADCRRIAAKNGIAFSQDRPSLAYKLSQLPARVHSEFFGITVLPKQLGVRTVADAGAVASTLYDYFMREHSALSLTLAAHLAKRVALKAKGMVAQRVARRRQSASGAAA